MLKATEPVNSWKPTVLEALVKYWIFHNSHDYKENKSDDTDLNMEKWTLNFNSVRMHHEYLAGKNAISPQKWTEFFHDALQRTSQIMILS